MKRPWCWERFRAGGDGDDRGWDGWMASLTQCTWVWVNSRSWWWTGRPGVLRFIGSQRVGHNWETELNWKEYLLSNWSYLLEGWPRDRSLHFMIISHITIFSTWYVSLPKTDVLFIIGDWNAKLGHQEIPGVTGKFGLWVQNEAGQRLTEFCQENSLIIANTLFQQHKRRLYTWTSPDGQYQN